MRDAEFVTFLQWALPQLRLRFRGYRRVRRQVRRRVARRMAELGLPDLAAYRERLAQDDREWRVLDGMCRISISRFYRDRAVWDALATEVLPELARRAAQRKSTHLRCWSIGCASGEEPYTLSILWRHVLAARFPDLELDVLASDAMPHLLERARAATYPASSLRELPEEWRGAAFVPDADDFRLRAEFRRAVRFEQRDIRKSVPAGGFDLILCRNLVLTYFERSVQERLLRALRETLVPKGALVIGLHERMPEVDGLEGWERLRCVQRRSTPLARGRAPRP